MKALFLSIFVMLLVACSPFGFNPMGYENKLIYPELYSIFGTDTINDMLQNTKIIKYKPYGRDGSYNYITNTIYIYSAATDLQFTFAHEATHFFQDTVLHRNMAAKSEYGIPENLSIQVSVEAEAQIVSLYCLLQANHNIDIRLYKYIKTYIL